MSKVEKMSIEEEAISNIKQDRVFIRKFIVSISQQIANKSGSEAKEVHKELGEIFSKYIIASVKNNDQLIELIKIKGKRNPIDEEDDEVTEDEIEDIYNEIKEESKEGDG